MTERRTRPTSEAPPTPSRVSGLHVLGGVLLGGVGLLLWAGLPTDALLERQSEFRWKLITGGALWLYIAFQWLLALSRVQGWNKISKVLFVPHQLLGVFGPVFFYAHAARVGFGYLMALSGAFLINLMLGLCQPRSSARSKQLMSVWLVAHIALSVLTLVLGAYHTWRAFYFE